MKKHLLITFEKGDLRCFLFILLLYFISGFKLKWFNASLTKSIS